MTAADMISIPRAEYDALVGRLEDAEDARAVDAFLARVAAVGFEEATRDFLPAELVWRLMDGEHPLRVWRDHRGMTGKALATASGVPQPYISEIENGKKPGSVDALSRLANALGVKIDDLVPQQNAT